MFRWCIVLLYRSEAWSAQKEAKARKAERRTKRERKREYLQNKRKKDKEEKEEEDDNDDWDELAAEERMAKKLKKGKIKEEEFDKMFMGNLAEESDNDNIRWE